MNVRGNVKFSSDLNSVMKPHRTYKDPVDKLRVSNPQALMDTDFEYSLQSTKWESVELQNNIPGIYQRANEPAYQGPAITSIVKTELGGNLDSAKVTEITQNLNGDSGMSWNLLHRYYYYGYNENRGIGLPFPVKIKGIEYTSIWVSSNGFFTFGSSAYNWYSNLYAYNRPPKLTVKLFNFRKNADSYYGYGRYWYSRGRLLRVGYRTINNPNGSGRIFIVKMNWNGYYPYRYTGNAWSYPRGAWDAEVRFFENQSYFEVHYDRNWGTYGNGNNYVRTGIADGTQNKEFGRWPTDVANGTLKGPTQGNYEIRGSQTAFRVDFFTEKRDVLKVTVGEVQSGRPFYSGMPIILKQTVDPTYVDGSYLIVNVFTDSQDTNGVNNTFALQLKSPEDYPEFDPILDDGVTPYQFNGTYTTIYTGDFFNSASILYTSITKVNGQKKVQIEFPYPHSLFVNSKIYVVDTDIDNETQWTGSHVISDVLNDYIIRYDASILEAYDSNDSLHTLGSESPAGSGLYPNQKTFVYVRNEGVSQHRFYDGGVQINPETNSPNTQIIRQTRKYFRYQSGKGIQFSSGILFSPNYDIVSLSITHDNGAFGDDLYSIFDMTIETDQEHGFTAADSFREGATINLYGLTVLDGVNPYNTTFTVQNISGPKRFTVSLIYPTTYAVDAVIADKYMTLLTNELEVTIGVNGAGDNVYLFNGEAYDNFTHIGFEVNTYTFKNIPTAHPLGFAINDTSLFEVTSGTQYQGSEVKIVEGITMVYYTGTITIDVKGDIGNISYSCYNHGYMGGQDRIKFKTDIVNNNDIFTESRMYPPARILNAPTTNISGYTYGDGEYIVSESSFSDTRAGWTAFSGTSHPSGYHGDSSHYDSTTKQYIAESVTPISGLTDEGEWIKIKLPTAINLTSYKITRRTPTYEARSPGKFKIYGSKDDLTWFEVVNNTSTSIEYTNNEFTESVNNNSTFDYFALVVIELIGNDTILNFDEFYLYGRELVKSSLFEDSAYSYLPCYYQNTMAEEYTNVSGWRLVRFLPENSSIWHPATDNLQGTDVYGTYNDSTNAWSIDFGTFDEFCFSTNTFSHWLYCTKSAVDGNYSDTARNIIRSSRNSSSHTKNWYNRSGEASDPWISIENHHDSENYMVYGESSYDTTTHGALITGNGGMCVWVRDSTAVSNNYTLHEITTSNPIQCDILVVAGGGAGGYDGGGGGGGGAIGYIEGVTLDGTYTLKVGRGGFATTSASDYNEDGIADGYLSSITDNAGNTLELIGGGSGAFDKDESDAGNAGGSGGGSAIAKTNNGDTSGTNIKNGIFSNAIIYSSVGKQGGTGFAGGGGGAGSTGAVNTQNGSDGYEFNISGTSYFYGAGGGGSTTLTNGGTGGKGGGGGGGCLNGIGGNAGTGGYQYNTVLQNGEDLMVGGTGSGGGGGVNANGGNASLNTGSGGGGGAQNSPDWLGGNGGSGIIIIKYRSVASTTRNDLKSLIGVKDYAPGGIGRVELKKWNDACVRSGLFDFQNGMFFEYDGSGKLAVVKRDSTEQIAGRLSIRKNSTQLSGTNTKFTTQLDEGGYIVLKGDSYLVTKIISDTELYIAPGYKADGFDNYKTVKINENRTYQENFSIDKLDGTGPSGYIMNINKMQMIFIDYSWYGAGKIRFGIRVEDGDIIYFHELKQNNINTEAYMRSGNIPGRFEISTKSKLASLKSVFSTDESIPEGKMLKILTSDAYKFPERGRIVLNNEYIDYIKGTNDGTYTILDVNQRNVKGRNTLVTGNINDTIISFNQNCSPSLSHWGVSCIMDGGFDVDKSYLFTATSQNYMTVNQNGVDTAILSIRLAPTVDYGIPGFFGVRNLINRSALALYSVGIGTYGASHIQCLVKINCESKVFENNDNWQAAGNGSIAQYLDHSIFSSYRTSSTQSGNDDHKVTSGDSIASFLCEGSSSRYAATEQIITAVRELSNSILGGPNAYPDGPDTLTIFLRKISGANTYSVARISWTEAQG